MCIPYKNWYMYMWKKNWNINLLNLLKAPINNKRDWHVLNLKGLKIFSVLLLLIPFLITSNPINLHRGLQWYKMYTSSVLVIMKYSRQRELTCSNTFSVKVSWSLAISITLPSICLKKKKQIRKYILWQDNFVNHISIHKT